MLSMCVCHHQDNNNQQTIASAIRPKLLAIVLRASLRRASKENSLRKIGPHDLQLIGRDAAESIPIIIPATPKRGFTRIGRDRG